MSKLDPFFLYQQAHLLDVYKLECVLEDIETARKVLEDAELVIDARQNQEPDEEEEAS